MNPYPLALLNHFTFPLAIPPLLSFLLDGFQLEAGACCQTTLESEPPFVKKRGTKCAADGHVIVLPFTLVLSPFASFTLDPAGRLRDRAAGLDRSTGAGSGSGARR